VQQIYALYPTDSGKFLNLGRIDVVTYKPQTAKVVVVSVNGNTLNTNELQARLNEIYNPVGVTFAIETDTFTYNSAINFFDETSGWFSHYTAAMKTFNIAYRENIGERYDKDKNYLFVLDEDVSRSDRDAQGFMPLGGRFGYLFKNQIPANEIHTIAAHELGHGIWALKHTFDNDYGDITVNTTENLMDYTPDADHLAKWQWEIIRYPALFTDPFGGDEEGEFNWIFIDIKHTLLFNHVYWNNLKTYNDTATAPYKASGWEKEWTYIKNNPEQSVNNVITKIKNTERKKTIDKITLNDYSIYIGKHTIDDKEYPIAVYSRKKEISNIKKVVITELNDLKTADIKKYMYVENNHIMYVVLAFYDDNIQEPVLMIQTPNAFSAYIDEYMKTCLKYLEIMEDSRDIRLENVRWISQFSSEINGRNCHWCATGGGTLCCNGGTPCETCPKDSTNKIKCCPTACTDTLQTTSCDSCANETICKTGTCKSNNCCFQTALAMIEQFGLTTNRNQAIDIATLINSNSWREQSDLQADATKFEESISYIDETLKSGNPVLIGVHYKNNKDKLYNANKATLHYMIIVGKIHKNGKEYYWFYDPAKTVQSYGVAVTNLLEIDRNKNMIHGIYQNDKPYTITEVRKNL
ncbi:MAG: hypothetical protein LBS69_11430, partial [Prevotellaceae bacterium]|jgi:hypothetical protein|nr:hypothetical protein [Prevotellaceae bacterium]